MASSHCAGTVCPYTYGIECAVDWGLFKYNQNLIYKNTHILTDMCMIYIYLYLYFYIICKKYISYI